MPSVENNAAGIDNNFEETLLNWRRRLVHLSNTSFLSPQHRDETAAASHNFHQHSSQQQHGRPLNTICLHLDEMAESLRQIQHQSRTQFEKHALPDLDFRLLQDEICLCFALLEESRRALLTSRRFVFVRYRAAVARQKEQECEQQPVKVNETRDVFLSASMADQTHEMAEPQRRESLALSILDGKNVLQGLSHVHITIDQDNVIRVVAQSVNDQGSSVTPLSVPNRLTPMGDASSLILSNIQHSKIIIRSRLMSVLISDLRHCRIVQEQQDALPNVVVEGAILVTNCSEVEFCGIHAHQLRIHTSEDLSFRSNCAAKSGLILEDSRRISLFQSSANSPWQVKDFSWLQRGSPSPNYTVHLVDIYDTVAQTFKTVAFPSSGTLPKESKSVLLSGIEQRREDDDEL